MKRKTATQMLMDDHLNIYQTMQSILMEIRIIRRNLDRWERRRDEERMKNEKSEE